MQRVAKNPELWIALGLLCLSLSYAGERYLPPSDLSSFASGLLLGLAIAANVAGIVLLPSKSTAHN